MKLQVSIDLVGWSLGSLVGSMNLENGVPPGEPEACLTEVPGLLAHLRRGGDDAAFLRAVLHALVHGHALTTEIAADLCGWSRMDIEAEQLRPVLGFMLTQVDAHLRPPIAARAAVELVHMGLHAGDWRPRQAALNRGVVWRPQDEDKSSR